MLKSLDNDFIRTFDIVVGALISAIAFFIVYFGFSATLEQGTIANLFIAATTLLAALFAGYAAYRAFSEAYRNNEILKKQIHHELDLRFYSDLEKAHQHINLATNMIISKIRKPMSTQTIEDGYSVHARSRLQRLISNKINYSGTNLRYIIEDFDQILKDSTETIRTIDKITIKKFPKVDELSKTCNLYDIFLYELNDAVEDEGDLKAAVNKFIVDVPDGKGYKASVFETHAKAVFAASKEISEAFSKMKKDLTNNYSYFADSPSSLHESLRM